MGVCNPTVLVGAASKLNALTFDVCFVSECSVTKNSQHTCAKELNRKGMQILWGHPAPPQRTCNDHSDSLRGCALGVAVVAKNRVALRPTRDKLPSHWDETCRIVVGFVQIRHLTVRLICVYGVQPGASGAFAKNTSLWHLILELLASSDVPTILGGDFNLRPQSSGVWSEIEMLGFREAFEHHELIHGECLPPTCNGVTRNDSIVYSRHFASCFVRANVIQEQLFASHDPLIVEFDLNVPNHVRRSLPLPTDLDDQVLSSDLFLYNQSRAVDSWGSTSDIAQSCDHACNQTNRLKTIGNAFEIAYDRTVDQLRNLEDDQNQFVRRQCPHVRRLHPRKPTTADSIRCPKKARNGDYEPPCEITRNFDLQLVRQVRRLQSFSRRAHLHQHDSMSESVIKQHRREWVTICFAPGFRPNFQSWVARNLMLTTWYDTAFAPCWWIADVYDKFKTFVDAHLRKEATKRRQKFQYKLDIDMLHFGGSLTHALLRKPQPPRPQCLTIEKTFQASLVRSRVKAKPRVLIPQDHELQLATDLRCEGQKVKLTKAPAEHTYFCDGLPKEVDNEVTLTQDQLTVDPDEASSAFFAYWDKYWMRDDTSHCPQTEWSEFLDFLDAMPSVSDESLSQPITCDEWFSALKKTKGKTARGICGFAQPELANMHVDLLKALLEFFTEAETSGLPPWMMVAKTVLIPKKEGTCKIGDLRPITIFSLLLRTWERVMARRLLRAWMPTLPASIVGGVPGRSCSQLTLTNAIRVEHALVIQSDAGGFSLDIAKCFNAVGRWPAVKLLTRAGMSQNFANMWHLSLSVMSRVVCMMDNVSDEHPASTGLPEGCPLSVCAMIQIGHGWQCILAAYGVDVSVFADDWSWFACTPEQHILAMRATAAWLKALKLHSDPAKCWVWGATPLAKKQWAKINELVVGSPTAYRLVFAEKNLGAFIHLSRTTQLGTQKQRIQEGINKLYRIGKLNLNVNKKAQLIQVNVWPTVFYGIEVLYVGQRHIAKLRSAAASSLVTKTPGTHVMLAVSCLSSKVVDPLLYILFRTLSLWRRLFLSEGSEAALARHLLIGSSDNPNKAFGPASALKCYLAHIMWKIDDSGCLIDHMNRQFELVNISQQHLFARLRDAWSICLQRDLQKRGTYHDWPEIDIPTTLRVQLPENSRDESILCIARTMGYLFREQCQHWDNCEIEQLDEENKFLKCPLCGAENTRQHHPFQCPAQETLQLEHVEEVTYVKRHFPHACFLPVIYMHPHLRVLQYVHNRREQPDPFNLPQNMQDRTLVFYTDGSSAFPQLSGGYLAGYAVVLDLLDEDTERIAIAEKVRSNQPVHDTFSVVQVALVSGVQTINRAELSAVIQVIRSCSSAVIYVDSKWTIDTVNAITELPCIAAHAHRQNFDLIVQLIHLASTCDLRNFDLRKIKSHIANEDVTDDLCLYHVIGNRWADEAARSSIQQHRSDVHKLAWDIGNWYVDQINHVTAYSKFLIATDVKRLEAFERVQHIDDGHLLTIEDAIHWNPVNQHAIVIDSPTSHDFLAGFLPGASFFVALRKWASCLRWPDAGNTKGGVSFYELACNFIGVTGLHFPRVVQRGQRYSEYADPRFTSVAGLLPQTVWDICRLIEHAFRFAYKVLGIELFPYDRLHRRQYLGFLGYKHKLAGFLARPVFPEQELHMCAMQRNVYHGQLHMPEPFLTEPLFPIDLHDLDTTSHKVRYRQFTHLQYLARGGPVNF